MNGPALILVGLAAGVFAGLFGIGGGVVIVPALVLFAGFSLVEATGTSLAAILLPVGILGVITYYRARIIDIRGSIYIAIGLVTTVTVGAWLAHSLPADLVKNLYAVFLIYVSWTFIDPVSRFRRLLGKPLAVKTESAAEPRPPALVLVGVGVVAGVMAGLFGIGGGNIIVPLLVVALHYPAKRAIATSLGTLLLPIGLPGVLYYYHAGTLDLGAAAWVALGLLAGTVFGAKINIRLSTQIIKLLYGLFLLFVAGRFML